MPQNVPIHGQITFFGSVVGSTALGAQPVGTTGILIQLPNTVATAGQVLEAVVVHGNTVTLGWGTGGGGGGPFSAADFLPLFTTTVTNPTTTPNLAFNATLQSASTFYAGPVSGFPSAAANFRAILASDIPPLAYVPTSVSSPANFVLATPNGSAGVPVPRALVAADIPNIAESQVINLVSDLNTLTIGLGGKAAIISPALTGVPTAPTAPPATDSTQIATTAYTDDAVSVEQSRALAAEAVLAAINAATLTGTPQVPTAAPLNNSNQIASTAYTDAAVGVETTRAETAEALLSPLTSPHFVGIPTAPTAAPHTNTTQIGTTAYTDAAVALFASTAVTSVAGRTGAVILGESDITNLVSDLAATEKTANKGVPNGYASLDATGVVPAGQLPPAVVGSLTFQGVWDANTNTPTLTSSVGTNGFFYIVSVAGNTTLDGTSSWNVGDFAIFETTWSKITGTSAVSSVAGRIGAVVLGESDITNLVADLAAKAPLASPIFTGVPTAPTAAPLSNNTQLSTTAYTDLAVGVETSRATTAEGLRAPLLSPTLTGVPHAPTPTPLNVDDTLIATAGYTDAAVAVEKSRAQGVEATLAPLASPGFTGNPTAPTQSPLTNNLHLANTAYVDLAVQVEKSRALAAEALKASSANPTFTGLTSLANISVSGTMADSLSSVGTNGQILSSTGSGVVWINFPSSSFSSLTSGTNTSAAMVVGSGSSLTFSGTGSIVATTLQAVAITSSAPTVGQVLTATSATTADWETPAGVPSGAANQVFATGPGGGSASLQSLTQSMLPNGLTQWANLPNVKLVPIYKQFALGGPYFDYYTVPAGRRALQGLLQVNSPASPPGEQQDIQPMLKVGGVYYSLNSQTAFSNAQPSTIPLQAYVAEAGEGFSLSASFQVASLCNNKSQLLSVANPTAVQTFILTSVFSQVSGVTEYVGTITGGVSNAFASRVYVVTGFTNASNNGTFVCIGSTTTTLTLINTGGVAETHAGTAVNTGAVYTIMGPGPLSFGTICTVSGCTNAANNGTFFVLSSTGAPNMQVTLANVNAVAESPANIASTIWMAGPLAVNGWVVEFDNTASLRSAKLLGTTAVATPETLYTPAGSKTGMLVPIGTGSAATITTSIFHTNQQPITDTPIVYYVPAAPFSYSLTAASTAQNGLTVYTGMIFNGGSQVGFNTTAVTVPGPFALTQVNASQTSAGFASYQGTFPATAVAGLAGMYFTITGFTNAGNNGTFLCVSQSGTTSINLANVSAITETHAGTATAPANVAIYTVAGNSGSTGFNITVTGMTNAGNNGTFLCMGTASNGLALYLVNPNAVTAAAQNANGTIQPLFGQTVTISGFSNAGNNGTFTCVGSNEYSITLSNSGGVAENAAATASVPTTVSQSNQVGNLGGAASLGTIGLPSINIVIANGDSLKVMKNYSMAPPVNGSTIAGSTQGGIIWCNVVEF